MSEEKHRRRHKHKHSNGKSFIFLPIFFFFGTYLVLYLALLPNLTVISAFSDMFFSDAEKNYSTDYENIFVPVTDSADTGDEGGNNNGGEDNAPATHIPLSSITFPRYGNQFGELIIPDCGVDARLFLGDGDIALRNGVGIYYGSAIPGYGKTILVGGHNNTYFNGLKYAEAGQTVNIRTSYGNYEYRITKAGVKKFNDNTAYDLTENKETLIMYTCYPFDELGLTDKRFFVYAEYVSGPIIDKDK